MDNETKTKLYKVISSLLTSCPISTNIEDWHEYLPKKCTRKFYIHFIKELERLDTWYKDIAVNLRDIVREEEDDKICN